MWHNEMSPNFVQEYYSEALLSIIEITNFKSRIFLEGLNFMEQKTILQSERRKLTRHFLEIPPECPRSFIVYGTTIQKKSFKSMATEIYLKYIKRNCLHEINVEWNTRMELAALIENRRRWKSNKEYNDPRNL